VQTDLVSGEGLLLVYWGGGHKAGERGEGQGGGEKEQSHKHVHCMESLCKSSDPLLRALPSGLI
jgi:hypothetical protein